MIQQAAAKPDNPSSNPRRTDPCKLSDLHIYPTMLKTDIYTHACGHTHTHTHTHRGTCTHTHTCTYTHIHTPQMNDLKF